MPTPIALGPTGVVLSTITSALQILNAVEPDIAAIINLFKSSTVTLESLLADADATEQADIAKIQQELGTPPAKN